MALQQSWFVETFTKKLAQLPDRWSDQTKLLVAMALEIDHLDMTFLDRERLVHLLDELSQITRHKCEVTDVVLRISFLLSWILVSILSFIGIGQVFHGSLGLLLSLSAMVATCSLLFSVKLMIPVVGPIVCAYARRQRRHFEVAYAIFQEYKGKESLLCHDLDLISDLDTDDVSDANVVHDIVHSIEIVETL